MDKVIAKGFILQQSTNQLCEIFFERYVQSNAPELFKLHKELLSIQRWIYSMLNITQNKNEFGMKFNC